MKKPDDNLLFGVVTRRPFVYGRRVFKPVLAYHNGVFTGWHHAIRARFYATYGLVRYERHRTSSIRHSSPVEDVDWVRAMLVERGKGDELRHGQWMRKGLLRIKREGS